MSNYTEDPDDLAQDDTGEAHISSSHFIDDTDSSDSTAGGSRISNFAEDGADDYAEDDYSYETDSPTQTQAGDYAAANSTPYVRESSTVRDHTTQPRSAYDDAEASNSHEDFGNGGSRAEFTTAFDIIDEMQKSLDDAKSVLFSPQFFKIDKAEFSGFLDELKKVLPVQLERASALMRESERRLEAAQEQSESVVHAAQRNAEDIIAKANEQATFLAGHQNVVALAEEKARDIISSAQSKADHVTEGANEYSATMLSNLDTELEKLSRDVKGGISILRTRQQEAASKLGRIDTDPANGHTGE
ncbi:MAG: cell division protein [Bifidobacteriaceae bacterium]|jgi:cell division septum initiation protein DivIVA|nr:cell division protein [Bifidobacteriaceae bacterium]